jgi:glycosyltransferase involved in cell wall biosynthesis
VISGYRRLLRKRRVRVLTQNEADRAELAALADLDAILIPGSGVDILRFRPRPESPPSPPITIVLAARLLWEKGVGEFAAAAALLRERGVECRCCLVGKPDAGNPASVTDEVLRAWHGAGILEWWGYRDDMAAVLARVHIACLPSYYREGIPKFLLEAAATGLPLVATDLPGCRDVVEPEGNGLLVPPRDHRALAAALERLVADAALRGRLGRRSRQIAEERFDQRHISRQVLAVYSELLGSGG